MRNLFIITILFFAAHFMYGQTTTYVSGYYKANGTYVQGHYRQTPNSTNRDNWTTKTQTNPYTQQSGSRAQDYSPAASNYGQGQTIYTGPRGGQYYFNSNGNKVYVPKN